MKIKMKPQFPRKQNTAVFTLDKNLIRGLHTNSQKGKSMPGALQTASMMSQIATEIAGALRSHCTSQLTWIWCTRKTSGSTATSFLVVNRPEEPILVASFSIDSQAEIERRAPVAQQMAPRSLSVSRAHSVRAMLPRCHSGHCEIEFISRIRLARRSRIVLWSVSPPTFPLSSPLPEAQSCSPYGWLLRCESSPTTEADNKRVAALRNEGSAVKPAVCERSSSPDSLTDPWSRSGPLPGISRPITLSQRLESPGDKWTEATYSRGETFAVVL